MWEKIAKQIKQSLIISLNLSQQTKNKSSSYSFNSIIRTSQLRNPSNKTTKIYHKNDIKKKREREIKRGGTWLNLVWRAELTSSKARRSVVNSLRASSVTSIFAIPSQSMVFPALNGISAISFPALPCMVLPALNATSTIFFPAPLIFSQTFSLTFSAAKLVFEAVNCQRTSEEERGAVYFSLCLCG